MKRTQKKIFAHFYMLFVALLFVFFMSNGPCVAQTKDEVMHAVGILKGVYDDYSKQEAINILESTVHNDSMAYAMNVLGLAYMEGVGVERDSLKAIEWLHEAGRKGFADAYHNLGALYKNGKCGMIQDFVKAYKAFEVGAKLGSIACMYDMGFMLYKGLGCAQNYKEAVVLFQSAADEGHVPSIYMLGLCYRNGYGVVQNEERGLELLGNAAALGFRAAIEELARPNPENSMHNNYSLSNITEDFSDFYKEQNTDINDTSLMKGTYEGVVVMYDWSGKYIIEEKPIVMTINRIGNDAIGVLVLGSDTVSFNADIQANGSLKFKKTYIKLSNRYENYGKVNHRLCCARLDIWDNKLRGKLSLYSLKEREPERPMYMVLYPQKTSKDVAGHGNRITITPNPSGKHFNVFFELLHDSETTIHVFDKFGKVVWRKEFGRIKKGKHRVELGSDLVQNYYILNIAAGEQTLRTIIVKNRGW